MASIAKRGAAWRASVALSGVRRTATFDTRLEAERWAAAIEERIAAGDRAPAATWTMLALLDRYEREITPTKGSPRWERNKLRFFGRHPLFAGSVEAVDAAAIAQWRDSRLARVAASTLNRELNLLSSVFTRAMKEWRVPSLVANPVLAIMRPRNPAARTRRVPLAERRALIEALGWAEADRPATAAQWTAWAFCFALETAMRKSEILSLEWRHVHLAEQWAHLPRTKNGQPRDVPLSTGALALLRVAVPGDGKVAPLVSGTLDQMFRRARIVAGLTGLTFHDSRREATSRYAETLGVLELSAVTGHMDVNLLRRVYYRPDVSALAKKLG